jgi:signal transduction histidine kinase
MTAIRGHGRVEDTAWILLVVTSVLFYLWATSEGEVAPRTLISLFGGAALDSDERPRSQYEQQFREAAKPEERNRLARDLHESMKR